MVRLPLTACIWVKNTSWIVKILASELHPGAITFSTFSVVCKNISSK